MCVPDIAGADKDFRQMDFAHYKESASGREKGRKGVRICLRFLLTIRLWTNIIIK